MAEPTAVFRELRALAEAGHKNSLLQDEQLLKTLQEVSSAFFAKTKHAEIAVEELVFETGATHVRLQNAITQISLLQNTQFIENRVYDEEEPLAANDSSKAAADVPLTSSASAAQVLIRLKGAYKTGMQALRFYRPHAIATSGAHSDAALFSNPYDMPLPFVIGSVEWGADPHVGLAGGGGEEEEGALALEGEEPLLAIEGPAVDADVVAALEAPEEGVLAITDNERATSRRQSTASVSTTEAASAPAPKALPKSAMAAALALVPEEEDDSGDLFGPGPGMGRAALPTPPLPMSTAPAPAPAHAVVEKDDEEEEDPRKALGAMLAARAGIPLPPSKPAPAPVAAAPALSSALVLADDDDDGGLFGRPSSSVTSVPATLPSLPASANSGGLFGARTGAGMSAGGAGGLFGDLDAVPVPPPAATRALVPAPVSLAPSVIAAPAPAPVAAKPTSLFGKSSLFGDDDDGDSSGGLFGARKPAAVPAPVAVKPASLFGRGGLFDDGDDEAPKAILPPSFSTVGLFGAQPQAGSLFGSPPVQPAPAPVPVAAPAPAPMPPRAQAPASSTSMAAMFGAPNPVPAQATAPPMFTPAPAPSVFPTSTALTRVDDEDEHLGMGPPPAPQEDGDAPAWAQAPTQVQAPAPALRPTMGAKGKGKARGDSDDWGDDSEEDKPKPATRRIPGAVALPIPAPVVPSYGFDAPSIPAPASSNSPPAGVRALDAGLAINPSAMAGMGGAGGAAAAIAAARARARASEGIVEAVFTGSGTPSVPGAGAGMAALSSVDATGTDALLSRATMGEGSVGAGGAKPKRKPPTMGAFGAEDPFGAGFGSVAPPPLPDAFPDALPPPFPDAMGDGGSMPPPPPSSLFGDGQSNGLFGSGPPGLFG